MATGPANWARWLSTSPQTGLDVNSPEAQQALAWVQQYDPSAKFTSGVYSPNGINWMDSTEEGDVLQYDTSKLPVNAAGGRGIEGIARGTPGSGEKLANPNAVIQDPIYGAVTKPQNLISKGPSMVEVLGPLMMSIITAGAAAPSLIGSLVSAMPTLARTASGLLDRETPFGYNNTGPSGGLNMDQMSNLQDNGGQLTPEQLALYQQLSRNGGGG